DIDGFVMSKCRASSPAVFSPSRRRRRTSRRVGSTSALNASFMCMAGTALVRALAIYLNNTLCGKLRQWYGLCRRQDLSGQSVVGHGRNVEGVRGRARRWGGRFDGASGEIKPLTFAVAQRR